MQMRRRNQTRRLRGAACIAPLCNYKGIIE